MTAVNSNGTYTVLQEDPNHESVVVNGTDYLIQTQTIQVNNSGQELSYAYVDAASAPFNCTYTPHGPGPDFPVAVGMSWTLDYTIACGGPTPVSYVQIGDRGRYRVRDGAGRYLQRHQAPEHAHLDGCAGHPTHADGDQLARRPELHFGEAEHQHRLLGTLPTTGYAVSREIILQKRS